MPNESSVKDKQPGEGDPLTFCLLETETESKFIFVLKCKIIAPYQFALMKFPLFHLLEGIEVHNHLFSFKIYPWTYLPHHKESFCSQYSLKKMLLIVTR